MLLRLPKRPSRSPASVSDKSLSGFTVFGQALIVSEIGAIRLAIEDGFIAGGQMCFAGGNKEDATHKESKQ
jgi:hypothetical protein